MKKQYVQNKCEIAENLRLLREWFGLTQLEIANKLNIERSTYTYYETGKNEPRLQILIKICEIYNIELTDLITKKGLLKIRIKMV